MKGRDVFGYFWKILFFASIGLFLVSFAVPHQYASKCMGVSVILFVIWSLQTLHPKA